MKATCITCPYWKHAPEHPALIESKIAGVQPTKIETGFCYHKPPTMTAVPVQSRIAGQMALQFMRTFPQMQADEFCAEHPERALARQFAFAQADEQGRRSMSEFAPEKHGDTHAGFNAPPSLNVARKLATVVQQCDVMQGTKHCALSAGHHGAHVFDVDAAP